MDTEGMDIMENLLFSAGRNTIFNLQLETSKCKWSLIPASHPTWSDHICDESCVCQVCVCVWSRGRWQYAGDLAQSHPPSSSQLPPPSCCSSLLPSTDRGRPLLTAPQSVTPQCSVSVGSAASLITPHHHHHHIDWWPVVNYYDVMMTTVMMTWWHQMTSQLWPICCHFCDLQKRVNSESVSSMMFMFI